MAETIGIPAETLRQQLRNIFLAWAITSICRQANVELLLNETD